MSPALIITPLLLLAGFGISFFFHGGHEITYAPAIFLVLVAALVAVLPTLRDRISFPCGACVLLTLSFWAYLSVSMIWTTVPFASLVTWLNLTVLPIILLGLLCSPARDVLIRYCVVALVAGTAIAAIFVLWQFFAEGVQRASGPLLNPNNMAALLNLSLLPVLAYAMGGHRDHRLLSSLLGLVLFAALIATGSRGGLLCFLAGSLVIAIALYKSLLTEWKFSLGVAGLLAAMFVGFYFLTHTALDQSLPIFGNPASDYSSFERVAIWKGALAMMRDHWLGGTGLGTFYLYYPAYRLSGDAVSMGHWAHFDALQFGIETGFLAMILFYAAAAAWLVRGVQSLSVIPAADPRRVLIAGYLAALLALVIHAHIEFQFYVMANLMMAAVLIAALYVLTSADEDKSFLNIVPEKRDGLIWSGALLVTAALVSLTLLSTAVGMYFLNRANDAINNGNIEAFATNISLSRQYAPRSFADADVQLAGLYVDLMVKPTGMMTAEDKITAYNDALQLLAEAQASNPAWGDIDHKRAKLYARIDDAHEPDHKALALASWAQALKKNPLHYHAREEYARYLIKMGRVEEAYLILQDGLHRPMTAPARASLTSLSAQIEPLVAVKRYRENSAP